MKATIISDGTQQGTKVLRADGGEPIPGICSVTWRIDVGGVAHADVLLQMVTIWADAETRVLGPGCKEVRRIEYADGTVDEYPA